MKEDKYKQIREFVELFSFWLITIGGNVFLFLAIWVNNWFGSSVFEKIASQFVVVLPQILIFYFVFFTHLHWR